ncbi:hypothetical protein DXG01_014453 [Tephrocybe rancida]|nr:hypothetical protein DXG01_014453 [Tephrocybe rancida]
MARYRNATARSWIRPPLVASTSIALHVSPTPTPRVRAMSPETRPRLPDESAPLHHRLTPNTFDGKESEAPGTSVLPTPRQDTAKRERQARAGFLLPAPPVRPSAS